jgi:AraC-like DNA-binding protein
MDPAPPDFRLLRFTSDSLPAADRLELWREIITRKLLRLSIDPLGGAPFSATATLRSQHGLSLGSGEIGPSMNRRTRSLVANDNDDLALMINMDTRLIARQGEREVILGPGDATLVSCTQPGSFERPEAGRLTCVRLPRSALTLFLREPEDHALRLIPRHSGPLQMLLSYVAPLSAVDTLALEPDVSRVVVGHITDLVGLSLGATGDAGRLAGDHGLRAARLDAIKTVIEKTIGPEPLSAEYVARAIGVSARYVRKLLEAEGQSFSHYVLERRLSRAREMLTSPRHAGRPISSIAYDVGFGDLSYFNRAFRRRYDRTPSELRAGEA